MAKIETIDEIAQGAVETSLEVAEDKVEEATNDERAETLDTQDTPKEEVVETVENTPEEIEQVLNPEVATEVADGEIVDVANDVANEEGMIAKVEAAAPALSKEDVISIISDGFAEHFAKHIESFDLDRKINDFIQRHKKVKEQKLEPDIKLDSLPIVPRRDTGIQVLSEEN